MMRATERVLIALFLAGAALFASLHPHTPKEVVTHRICYPDDAGNKVCE